MAKHKRHDSLVRDYETQKAKHLEKLASQMLKQDEKMQKLKEKGLASIFVTHDIPSAFEIADRIAILYQGKIYVIDTTENIKKSKSW